MNEQRAGQALADYLGVPGPCVVGETHPLAYEVLDATGHVCGGINGIGGSRRGAEALIRVLYEAVGAREGWSTAEGRVRALLRAAGALGGS